MAEQAEQGGGYPRREHPAGTERHLVVYPPAATFAVARVRGGRVQRGCERFTFSLLCSALRWLSLVLSLLILRTEHQTDPQASSSSRSRPTNSSPRWLSELSAPLAAALWVIRSVSSAQSAPLQPSPSLRFPPTTTRPTHPLPAHGIARLRPAAPEKPLHLLHHCSSRPSSTCSSRAPQSLARVLTYSSYSVCPTMRPSASDVLGTGPPRPRKLSSSHSPPQYSSPAPSADDAQGMTYFLADEATVQAATAASNGSSPGGHASRSPPDSPKGDYGVRSMAESSIVDERLCLSQRPRRSSGSSVAVCSEPEEEAEEQNHDEDEEEDDGLDATSLASAPSSAGLFTHEYQHRLPKSDLLSLSPMLGSLGPTPERSGTPRSGDFDTLRDTEEKSDSEKGKDVEDGGCAMPQLIMPEITMPSRRPFTEKGKRVGRLKVMIAGDSGIGKTSLIKSIVQVCEDIVHVDPLSSGPPISVKQGSSSFGRSSGSSISSRRAGDGGDTTRNITEVHASTRPYPSWWSEIDDSKVLRKRKSSYRTGNEEQVIERNLCFVDTPGYGNGTSFLECIEPVVRYVEAQFERTQSIINNGEGELMSILSGSGTPQVDIVFYVVLHRLKPVDIEFIRRLSPFTSVLPVIAKVDTLSAQQVAELKVSIVDELRRASIKPFLFGKSHAEVRRNSNDSESVPCPPFAISSLASSDSDNMDASVLMSPDYVPPLIDTELRQLVDQVLDPENIAWLRHAASKKFMQWRMRQSVSSVATGIPSPFRPATPVHGRGSPGTSLMLANTSLVHLPTGGAADTFALARVADHTLREERLAKNRLQRWAHDLQRSLQAERERYDRLARGDRAIWLTERLDECIKDGQLVPISSLRRKGRSLSPDSRESHLDTRDPFGILKLNETMGDKVAVLIKVAGLGGLVGFVGIWVFGQWGPGKALVDWVQQGLIPTSF